jgi:hypothetical protein
MVTFHRFYAKLALVADFIEAVRRCQGHVQNFDEGPVLGDEERQEGFIMLSSLEDRVPQDHPLRPIRRVVDRAFAEMSPLFDYPRDFGCPRANTPHLVELPAAHEAPLIHIRLLLAEPV